MKKKIIFVVLLILSLLVVQAALADFDLSFFEKGNYNISRDDGTSNVHVFPKNHLANYFIGDFTGGLLRFYPTIKVERDSVPTLRLNSTLLTADALSPNAMNIIVDGKTYKTTPFCSAYEGCSCKLEEDILLPLGQSGLPLINDLRRAKEVKIQLIGFDRTVDFLLPQKIIEGTITMYDDFIAAGGSLEDSINENEQYLIIAE